MRRKIARILTFGIAAFALNLLFTNCAPFEATENDFPYTPFDVAFFGYKYDAAPKDYFDVRLFKESPDDTGLIELRVIASWAPIKQRTNSVVYRLRVLDANGLDICPEGGGTLDVGFSSMELVCATPASATNVTVRLEVKGGGETDGEDRVIDSAFDLKAN